MNKYPTIDMQIYHLKNDKNIQIKDEPRVMSFLKEISYEKSIKEIKPMFSKYVDDTKIYPQTEWDDIEQLYYNYLNQSKSMLSDIIKIENKMKSILIYLLQIEEKYKIYITDVPRFMEENYKYYERKYQKNKSQIKSVILNEKFYLVVNALGFKELINLIFQKIYTNDKVLYESFIADFLEGDKVLKKVSDLNKGKQNITKLFDQPLTFKECIAYKNHSYYNPILNTREQDIMKIAYEIEVQVQNFLHNMKTEVKFTTSSQFTELKLLIEDTLKINISNNKLGNFFYEGEINVNEIIADYKENKILDVKKIGLVAKYVSVSITLFAISTREYSSKEIDVLLKKAEPGEFIHELNLKVNVEHKNRNLKKYLKILADVRNSIAHGGTFIIPLFKDYDGDLRVTFAKQYLGDEDLKKIIEGRRYYRINKK